jgi:hypothetical protein
MKRFAHVACALMCGLLPAAVAQEEEPALPPGLAQPSEQAAPGEPALPPGLTEPSTEPELPPGLADTPEAQTEEREASDSLRRKLQLHGFWETRGGIRVLDDPAQSSDAILGETRLQLEMAKEWPALTLEFTGDFLLDGVLEEADFDLRKLRVVGRIGDRIDYSVGRQVLTWGTGDLLFINDLFPKDWQSFLAGRDVEYLKAPSDAFKVSWFGDALNVDLVYTPRFDPDRYITGERISYYNPLFGSRSGENMEVVADEPDDWFSDDEIAIRAYRTIGATEVAVYAYDGFWKSPAGQQLLPMRATFPRLSVYGASIRGTIGKGVANAEIGYYDSRDDAGGDKPFVENSEFRLLLGYERELAKEFTGAVQYYLVHMMDYDAYRDTLPFFVEPRDENRHVVTFRLTKLLMDQDLTLSSFLFYSPSDGDAYWRPTVSYKVTDNWELSAGGNLFFGEADHTFFGQFQNNSNIYAGARFSF